MKSRHKKSLISIIVRTYNSEKYIDRCLDSINKLIYYDPLEILVIDDGSDDDTLNLLSSYDDIKVIKSKHIGPMKVLNKAIKESKGEYFVVIDSDDEIYTNYLLETTRYINRYDYIWTDYHEQNEDKKKLIKTKNNIYLCGICNILYRKSAIEELGYFREDLVFPEYDMFYKLEENYKGVHVDKILSKYNRRNDSITGDKDLVKKGIKQIKELYGDLPIRKY